MCQNTGSYNHHLSAITAVQAVQAVAHPSLASIPGTQAHSAAPMGTLRVPWGCSPAPVGTREVQGQTGWAVSERKGPQKEKAEVQSTPVHGVTGPPALHPELLPAPEIPRRRNFLAWDRFPGCQDVSLLNKIFRRMLFRSLQLYLFSWFSLRLIRNGERARDMQKRL